MQQDDVKADTASSTPTPSPTASGTAASTSTSSASRRPPRKSTLTQQQKLQKRQRATQDQLVTLEMEFNRNPTPTANVRERIAQDINMTERSVQIWFQNRRAKIKGLAKKSIENGEDCDGIPESMRRYLAMQAMESGKSLGRDFLARTGGLPYGSGAMLLNNDPNTGKVVIHHFSCRSLSIGSWRRVGQTAMDLVIFFSPDKACITYYINNDSAGYKIEYPFSYIKNITVQSGDPVSNAEGAAQRPGGIVVELFRPPNFFMDGSRTGGFYQCGDFTEDQQASQIMVHHLGGHPKVLSGQLAKLVALESFQSRHNTFDANAFVVSAPVSPIVHRPASQPNHFIHPHTGMFQENAFLQPGPPRGHKRQRSRSVPVAVDFSMFRAPTTPFFVPPPQEQHAPIMQSPDLYAPIPQHSNNGFAPGPIGPNLSIDTSAGYGFDFRQHPMSATTANSPSDFGTPAFFHGTTSGPSDAMAASSFNTPYNMSFLSPGMLDPSAMLGTSTTPLSAMSHGDPVIANQSPPLSSLGRSGSADLYPMSQEQVLDDDSLALTELYSKQSLNLPFRSPMVSGAGDDPMVGAPMGLSPEDLDMSSILHYGTIDPSSLSPDHHTGL